MGDGIVDDVEEVAGWFIERVLLAVVLCGEAGLFLGGDVRAGRGWWGTETSRIRNVSLLEYTVSIARCGGWLWGPRVLGGCWQLGSTGRAQLNVFVS